MTIVDATSEDPGDRVVGADRVLAVLTELAEHPSGISLDDLSRLLKSSKSTVHRALASLRKAGFADQSSRGVYVLGDEFLRLAFRYSDRRPESTRVEPLLRVLATQYGETAHYAVLDGQDVVYRAKVDPPIGAMRLTSTVGGRNPAMSTAVGKLLLSFVIDSEQQLKDWLGATPLPPHTPNTITTVAGLFAELQRTRERGYGVDDQENDPGVNCVALPLFLEGGSGSPTGAVSVSGLAFRAPLTKLVAAVPEIRATIDRELGSA
ncbi:MAG: IclR family transcriptional regulator, regulon repressor [Actinomycetota bacterium]|jgi:IclR family acetate operon transcriptional repressor|nr:IclR family transcriptional regulator, regulon repressor [Actinomycetota bacterium]